MFSRVSLNAENFKDKDSLKKIVDRKHSGDIETEVIEIRQ